MKTGNKRFFFPRARLLRNLLLCCFLLIGAKVVLLSLFTEPLLNSIANKQYHDDLNLTPYRGTIYDRRGIPLAISVRRPSLAINPRVFRPNAQQKKTIAQLLNMPVAKITKLTQRPRYFAWLQRKVAPALAEQVLALRLKGIYQLTEPFRYYPLGEKFAHLIGYVGIDNTGLLGIEQRYEKQLHGQRTDLTLIKDARNQPVFYLPAHAQIEEAGYNMTLTLDRVIQEISMEELAIGVANAKAQKGFVIVADPHTGQVLALANYPSFDPNLPRFIRTRHTKNTAVSTLYEPGSIIKPLVIARALDLGLTRSEDLHYCDNGLLEVGNTFIRDDHPHPVLSTADILTFSSNICTYKVAALLGAKRLWQLYHDFGLGTAVNDLSLPGQAVGKIKDHERWSPIRFANISFGQGMSTTGIELVNAYNAIANGGKLLRPYLLTKISDDQGKTITEHAPQVVRQVLRPETARLLRSILGRVIKYGTGKLANPQIYSAGGKTSTAEIFDRQNNRYSRTKRIAGFIGFAPLADPHITIYVSIFAPTQKPYYGGKWAAPVFANITRRVLDYLNVRKVLADGRN